MDNLINSLLYLTNIWPFFYFFWSNTWYFSWVYPGLTTTMLITLTLPLTFYGQC